jgi:hypothetical protein
LLIIGATIAARAPLTKNPGAIGDRTIVDELDTLREKLEELKQQHRELDDQIARLGSEQSGDQLALQRLKRRKLMLKDQMTALNARLIPDIIA